MIHKESIWRATSTKSTLTTPPDHALQIDILIIGAGITGLTTALQLLQAGKQVAIIDAHKIGEGTTGSSTANLYVPVQPSYRLLKFKFGLKVAKAVMESRQAAINFIEQTVNALQIDCHFTRRPAYLFATKDKYARLINAELKVLTEAGIPFQEVNDIPLATNVSKAIMLPNQARFNPYQYLLGLADKLRAMGCVIYEETSAVKVIDEGNYVHVDTVKQKILANKVVVATHLPIGVHKSQFLAYPYRSYAMAVTLQDNHYVNGHFFEIAKPSYSFSTHNIFHEQMDYMVVAGHSHKIGHPKEKNHEQHFTTLEKHIRATLPVKEITYRWSAQHYQSADGLPFIGNASRSKQNIYVGTGYHADGLVYGTVAGMVIADLILQKPNPWVAIYSPNRCNIFSSLLRFSLENTRVFIDYVYGYGSYFIKKLLPSREPKLKAGEGKVINYQGKLCAAYRDQANQLHLVSAICTHMACPLKFNDAEKSWDCPCHGSRFAIDGKVIEGPATAPLAKIT